jgi:hypothetical protein
MQVSILANAQDLTFEGAFRGRGPEAQGPHTQPIHYGQLERGNLEPARGQTLAMIIDSETLTRSSTDGLRVKPRQSMQPLK